MKTNLTDNAYETFRDFIWLLTYRGFSPVSDVKNPPPKKKQKRIHPQCRRPGFDPWVGKIPGRREELLTAVFWPGEFHPGRLQSMGSQSQTRLSDFHFQWPIDWHLICCTNEIMGAYRKYLLFKIFLKFTCLFLAAPSLHCFTGFSLVAASRVYSVVCSRRDSHCSVFPCCRGRDLGCVGSVVVAPGL